MFETTHLECSEFGSLRLKLTTPWASVFDDFDHDFGTVEEPAWPEELGQLPDWFWPEVLTLWHEYRDWRDRRVA